MGGSDPEDPRYDAKTREVKRALDDAHNRVRVSIEEALNRGENLDGLEMKADNLVSDAELFHSTSRQTRRMMCWNNMRNKIILIVIGIACTGLIIWWAAS